MSKGEDTIARILVRAGIVFEREKRFEDLKQGSYRYDFFIANYSGRPAIIEFHGAQHYQYIKQFYPSEQFWRAAKERDRRKISYALANGIDIYIIPYWDLDKLNRITDLFQSNYKAHNRWHVDNTLQPK